MSQDNRLCKVRSVSVRVSGLDGKGWKKDPILANEFIQEIERALLELIKAGFRGAVPHAEPHAAIRASRSEP